MIRLKCNGCEIEFDKPLNEYNRQARKGKINFYCSLKCQSVNKNQRKTHSNIERECLFCKSKFISTTHKRYRKCCSNNCARRYSQSFVNVKKISQTLKRYNQEHSQSRKTKFEDRVCPMCNNTFNIEARKTKKTCSNKCFRKLISTNSTNNPNCGGETNYRKYQYNGIWMDSTWEVEIAKWMDDNNIKWKRDRNMRFSWTDLTGKKRRYYPDFYLTDFNIYLDPKNKHLLKKDNFKLNQVIKENKISLIYGLKSDIIDQLKNLV